jgi:hypothetical protein
VEAFFTAHPCPSAERTIKQSLETIRSNAAWVKRDAGRWWWWCVYVRSSWLIAPHRTSVKVSRNDRPLARLRHRRALMKKKNTTTLASNIAATSETQSHCFNRFSTLEMSY